MPPPAKRSHVARSGRVTLVRALSKLGIASRKDAGALIVSGRVSVDGQRVTTPALLVNPERIQISVDDAEQARGRRRVVMLNKPRGVVTTRRDPQGRRTVFDVLGPPGDGLVAVGRLDLASSGLLLFTNDTQLAHRLTDPERQVPRTYVVTVRGRVASEAASRLTAGVLMPGSGGTPERLAADRVEIRKPSGRETHLIVTLTEGKNREIRRLFEAIGHEVTRLHRIAFGPIPLGRLAPGEARELAPRELEALA